MALTRRYFFPISAEFFASISDNQIHQPLEIFGGIEGDSDRAFFFASQIDVHVRLQVLTQLVFDLLGRCVGFSRRRSARSTRSLGGLVSVPFEPSALLSLSNT